MRPGFGRLLEVESPGEYGKLMILNKQLPSSDCDSAHDLVRGHAATEIEEWLAQAFSKPNA